MNNQTSAILDGVRITRVPLMLGLWLLFASLNTSLWAGGSNYVHDAEDQHFPGLAGYNGDDASKECSGLARWWVSEPYISLRLEDRPLSYQPSRGPQVAFQLSYAQRSALQSSTNVFNIGPLWECSWLSWLEVECSMGFCVTRENGFDVYSPAPAFVATLHLPGGGTWEFSQTVEDVCSNSVHQLPDYYGQGRLLPIIGDPYQYWNFEGFQFAYADGSREVYACSQSLGFTATIYRSSSVDANGNITRFIYQTNNGIIKLTQILDVDGKSCWLRYANANFPTRITSVEDPYGRTNRLFYDTNGWLKTIEDTLRPTPLSSEFTYATNGMITTLTTPYGPTYFTPYGLATNVMTGTQINRALWITTPDGGTNLYAYRDDCSAFQTNYHSTQTPLGAGPLHMLSTNELSWRNSFSWNAQQCAALSTINLSNLTASDYAIARMRNWLWDESSLTGPKRLSPTLNCERSPSPDGTKEGQLTWFDYQGKVNNNYEGTIGVSCAVVQRMPDNAIYYSWYQRDAFGNATNVVETISSSTTRTNTFLYSTNGADLLEHRFNNVLIAQYDYDDQHQLRHFTNAVGEVTTLTYDGNDRLQMVEYPNGQSVEYYYWSWGDYAGWLDYTLVLDPESASRYYTYSNGLVRTIRDERNLTVTLTWDGLQRLTKVSYPDSSYIEHQYDKLDLAATRDREGNWTHYGRDLAGRVTAVTNALQKVTQFGWCGCGTLESVTDALNNTTSFYYNYDGTLRQQSSPGNRWVQHTYDRLGRRVASTNSEGRYLTFTHSQQGITAINNDAGVLLGVSYTQRGLPWQVTDAFGRTATNSYDWLERLTNRSWTGGRSETFTYTTFANGGMMAYVNSGEWTHFEYDQKGRLTGVTNANGSTRYRYNAADDLTSLADANERSTTWQPDEYGRLWKQFNHNGVKLVELTYNRNGQVTNSWIVGNRVITNSFDAVGNLRQTTTPSPQVSSIYLNYDAKGRLTNMVDRLGPHVFRYTSNDELESEDGPWTGDIVSFAYDTTGLRTNLVLSAQPSAVTWTSGYDSAARLRILSSPAGSFSYDYDAAPRWGLVGRLGMPNGSATVSAFDSQARLLSTILSNSSQAVLHRHGYQYDVRNRRECQGIGASIYLNWASNYVTYSYDSIGQLWTANGYETNGVPRLHEQFANTFDAAGNLRTRTRNGFLQDFYPDELNQLNSADRSGLYTLSGWARGDTSKKLQYVTLNGTNSALIYGDGTYAATNVSLANGANTFTTIATWKEGLYATNTVTVYLPESVDYTYANGNLDNDGQRFFEYDASDQLTAVTLSNAWRMELQYDGLNRMRVRREYGWLSTWQCTNEVRYVYDGNLVLQERHYNPQLSTNAPQSTVTYTRGPDQSGTLQAAGGIGGLLARTVSRPAPALGEDSYYYQADGNGNITAMINAHQRIVARYHYDPYGNLLNAAGPQATANTYRFSSKEHFGLADIYGYGARFYVPSLQRWLNQDPLGESGGINLYQFARNDPVNFVDAYGMVVLDADGFPVEGSYNGMGAYLYDRETRAQHEQVVAEGMARVGRGLKAVGEEMAMAACTAGAGQLAKLRHLPKLARAVGRARAANVARVNGTVGFSKAAKTAPGVKYIGKLDDLQGIPRSQTLLDDLPNLRNPRANYYQNSSVLRKALRDGYEIRDASAYRPNWSPDPTLLRPDRTVGQSFLGAERLILDNKGLIPGPNGAYVPR